MAWHDIRSNALAIYYLNFMYRTQKLFSSHFHLPRWNSVDGQVVAGHEVKLFIFH